MTCKLQTEPQQQRRGGEQRRPRSEQGRERADEHRADDERRLVRGSLVGECGRDEPPISACRSDDGTPAHAGELTDLRQREPGERRDDGRQPPGRIEVAGGDDTDEARRAAEALHEKDARLAEPVGEGTEPGRTDGVAHRQRSRADAGVGVGVGRRRDEQQRAELRHGQWQARDERDDDVPTAREPEQP